MLVEHTGRNNQQAVENTGLGKGTWVVCVTHSSCLTLCDPMDCSPPGSSVHEILQAIILEQATIPFFRGSSWPRDWTQLSPIAGRFFTLWATQEKTFMLGKIEGQGRRGRQRMRWLDGIINGHEFEQAPGVGGGQGSLECCGPWDHRVSDMTEQLNWTELPGKPKITDLEVLPLEVTDKPMGGDGVFAGEKNGSPHAEPEWMNPLRVRRGGREVQTEAPGRDGNRTRDVWDSYRCVQVMIYNQYRGSLWCRSLLGTREWSIISSAIEEMSGRTKN